MSQILPDNYKEYTDDKLRQLILNVKKQYDKNLVILGHHYQREDVIEFADYRGDSLELCQKAAIKTQAKFIVFCGVYFMAESADILSADNQIVHLPDTNAGCPLADFASIDQVERTWQELAQVYDKSDITPITYINSNAELKAFCGRNGGSVCTSSNADKILKWALRKSKKVFFFPDQHLGRNTARKMGIPQSRILQWDFESLNAEQIDKAQIILWNGYCHVHTLFRVDHIYQMRKQYPNVKIIVHPECTADVVEISDAVGSTGYIVNYIANAPAGSIFAVGTELNLVNRLALIHSNKKIIPLARSLCPNMFKINLNNLCWTLHNLGKINIISVPSKIKQQARIALEQMLALSL